MKTTIKYKCFFAYSPDKKKLFHTEFGDSVNIIYGGNTSGKSTLIQSLNYTFGINDEKHKLKEIFDYVPDIIFRLDIELLKENIIIIRENDFLYIKRENEPIVKFSGISANNSQEHIGLKKYLAGLFGFRLYLESSNEYNLGSIESIFLPYYVAQDYGWVLTLKSFRSFEFIKNFKVDYYDYYLGIVNNYNREEKQRLEKLRKKNESEINVLREVEKSNDELQLSRLMDDAFIQKTSEYLDSYKSDKEELIKLEKEYIQVSNRLRYLEERKNILHKVKQITQKQNPLTDNCPTCRQALPNSVEDIYNYYQDFNNTVEESNVVKKEIKDKKGDLNSKIKKISELKINIQNKYRVLEKYQIHSINLKTWIENKVNIQTYRNIQERITKLEQELNDIKNDLKQFRTEAEIIEERNYKANLFTILFRKYLLALKVELSDNLNLYKMELFPKQGVELLKTLLAYYFAFNKLISQTSYVHRLPLIMDAIFKEDVDDSNKKLIAKFISENKPLDTQTIFSISESKDNAITAKEYNRKFFNDKAHLILIDLEHKRAFLGDSEDKYKELINDTISLTLG